MMEMIGKYRVLRELGRGGLGQVYEAVDSDLDRQVAIKIMTPPRGLTAGQARKMFDLERKILGALEHPNIVVAYESGEHEGNLYLVMQRLAGASLEQELARGRLPMRRAIAFATQIAAGLGELHRRGGVHRDIKPQNIFVTDTDVVKILDFGIAQVHIGATLGAGAVPTLLQNAPPSVAFVPGRGFGTPGYMAPEQALGERVDQRADLYALGCVLYEMLTATPYGHCTFDKNDIEAVVRGECRPMITVDGVPRELMRLVERLLAGLADARPATAAEVIAELDACARVLDNHSPTPVRVDNAPSFMKFVRARVDETIDRLARTVVGRESELLALDELLEGTSGRVVLLKAPMGFGKSSLLAAWVRRLRESGRCTVVPHFFTYHDDVTRKPSYALANVLNAIESLCGIVPTASPSSADVACESIHDLLITHPIAEKLVIVIDGLDEAQGVIPYPFPHPLPGNVVVVAAARAAEGRELPARKS